MFFLCFYRRRSGTSVPTVHDEMLLCLIARNQIVSVPMIFKRKLVFSFYDVYEW